MTQSTTTTRRCDVDAAFRQVLRAERKLFQALGREPRDLDKALKVVASGRVLHGLGEENAEQVQEALGQLGGMRSGLSVARIYRAVTRLRLSRMGLLDLLEVAKAPTVRRAIEGALDSRDQVVELNQGLIARQVYRVLTVNDRQNVDLREEAQQQASLALLGSVDRFQPRFGCAFSTFALPAVEHAIRDARDAFRSNLRVPDEVRGLQVAYLRKESELFGRMGRTPTRTEVAETLAQPLEVVERMLGAVGIEERLDEPTPEGEGWIAVHQCMCVSAPQDEGMDTHELGGWVKAAFACLSGLQARVLAIRFGFEGESRSRPQAAQALGLSSAQVARLEREGLNGILRSLGPERGQEIRRRLGVVGVCA